MQLLATAYRSELHTKCSPTNSEDTLPTTGIELYTSCSSLHGQGGWRGSVFFSKKHTRHHEHVEGHTAPTSRNGNVICKTSRSQFCCSGLVFPVEAERAETRRISSHRYCLLQNRASVVPGLIPSTRVQRVLQVLLCKSSQKGTCRGGTDTLRDRKN